MKRGPEYSEIQVWRPEGPHMNPCSHARPKRLGIPPGYNTPYEVNDNSSILPYEYFPLDCRILCRKSTICPCNFGTWFFGQNHVFPIHRTSVGWIHDKDRYEDRVGDLNMNLKIMKDVTTFRENATDDYETFNPPLKHMTPLTVNSPATLTIAQGKKYTCLRGYIFTDPEAIDKYYFENPDFYFTVKSGGKLVMELNSQIELNSLTHLTLESGSHINATYIPQTTNVPHILIKGGEFCNHATISGTLLVRFSGRSYMHIQCDDPDNLIFNDSTIVQFSDSCFFEIPDNKTLIIEDPETELILDSNSTIKFGNNSSLIIRNGAKINANYAKFIPLNENSTWGGIYIENAGANIIKNCLVENSLNGILISNEISQPSFLSQSTEISGCTIKNSSNVELNNGIYISNYNNLLLKDNQIYSTNLANGFSNGISLEYCPSGFINLIGNGINNALTGINIIQTTAYIFWNSITGQSNSNYGILLDNSSSVIKNNTINNFNNSIYSLYSTPYLLKNNFSSAVYCNIELQSYSLPVMSPIINNSSLYWLSGNNNINGNPSSCGIIFQDESYPGIDNGYNIVSVNGSPYIIGTIPSVLDASLQATFNNWQDAEPIPSKFQTQDGIVIYDPTFDGVSVPGYDYFELTDIGFGFNDTLYIKNLGDFRGGESIFLQAYKKESQGQFSDAITKYKQIIVNNKKSIFAHKSLCQIFNCIEKSKQNSSYYTSHQNYLNQIKNNNQYPKAMRELAEDFIIKTKIRRSLINDAISDYNEIYLQNQNNTKGIHALLNKETLIALKQDTTDGKSNPLRYKNYMITHLNNGKTKNNINVQNIPKQFEMFGNYPNPFNPQTKIKFGLPQKSFITLKIYDITGREIETLSNDYLDAGYHILLFNGSKYSSGIYFYKLVAENKVFSGKMVLIK